MSTKIFNAYRIPKSEDILNILKQAKNIARDYIANDEQYLKVIHGITMFKIAEKIKKDPKSKNYYQTAIDDNKKGKLDIWAMIQILEENTLSIDKLSFSTKLDCSIFYDDDYWYIKFFPNENIQYKIIKEFEKLGFEDYHYQNQTDPPEDMDYDKYKERGKKWDELTESSGGDYMDGFVYEIFGPEEFKKLLEKNWYTGEKDLYKHLAYKFDKVFFKDKL